MQPYMLNAHRGRCALETKCIICTTIGTRCRRCRRYFRAQFGIACNAPSLVKFVHALTLLRHKPDFNWLCAFLAEARAKVDRLTSRELAVIVWAMAKMGHKPDLIYMEIWYRWAYP